MNADIGLPAPFAGAGAALAARLTRALAPRQDWTLPPPRPRAGTLKPLATAHTMMARLPGEQLLLVVEHERLAGVSPGMLEAWWRKLPGTIWHAGREYARHALWHPVDHVHGALEREAPGGGFGVGARWREVVALGGNPQHLIDVRADVLRLDAGGVTLVRRLAGVEVMRLEHRFEAGYGGTEVVSMLWVGIGGGSRGGWREAAARWFNRQVLPQVLPEAAALAWLRHCVEKVGLLQSLLPRLAAAARAEAGGASSFQD